MNTNSVQQKDKEEEPSRLKGERAKREKQTLPSTLEIDAAAPLDLLLLVVISYCLLTEMKLRRKKASPCYQNAKLSQDRLFSKMYKF